ncbi:hypothetical protein B7P43_G07452 [Cryptotermes secundus]|uniref:Uncharacterized protein n=2 Tax=Cryptotermes secundus TaxID=105785 RepID=A0A2J7RDM1_9NEOP|nr:hypothetical protein B7P43_G07452 [Cryptotermes secundus]
MQIFSEDETLTAMSVGSGSIVSHPFPRMGTAVKVRQQMMSSKRMPVPRARPEDPLSGCPSADPSPKKQKTCAAPISPQGSSRSKRSRLEEQLACSAAELRYIDSQSPENQQLLVQAEVHPHRRYMNVSDPKPPTMASSSAAAAASPPNTVNAASAHTDNTSPSLAEATVSDNESFTLHSSGLPTPDTPLLLYTPLLDDETCSNSSTTNTPDYDLKLTPSPATPGSTKYHLLGAPSLSPSPTPTPTLTPNLDGENSYENILTQAVQCSGVRYENVPGPLTNVHMSNSHSSGMSVYGSKYVNVMGPLQTEERILVDDTSPSLAESQTRNENFPSKGKDCDVYEPVTGQGLSLEDSVTYEPVNIPQCQEDCIGLELASNCNEQRVYQNVPNSSCADEEHLYEVLQLNPAASSSSPQKSAGHVEEVKSDNDVEVYQQVKYFRQSIHEVNQLLGEPGCDVMDPGDKTLERLGGNCDSEVVEAEKAGVTQESVQTQSGEVPQECSFVEAFCEKLSPEDSEEMEPSDTGQHEGCSESGRDGESVLQSCDIVTVIGSQTTQCQSAENCDEGSKRSDSVIEGRMILQIKTSERQTSNDRNESEVSPVCASVGSPQLSPEHRRLAVLDPNPNRRKFESEIGRDILRERRMRQELEEMRIANQGSDGTSQQSQKQSSKCNIRELLSKFETSPTLAQHGLDGQSSSTTSRQRFSFSSHETAENLGMNSDSITSTLNQKLDSHSVTVSDMSLDTKPNRVFISVNPDMSEKDSGFTSVMPNLPCHSGPSPHGNSVTAVPPCEQTGLAKAARGKLANSTALSVSLGEGEFLASSSEDPGQLVRVQTSPDINDTREHEDSLVTNDCEKNKSASQVGGVPGEKTVFIAAIGLDDPERRERIERYKEERRLFLREKYRSESFRGERDEILQRLKQKAGKSVSGPAVEPVDISRSFATGSDRVRRNSCRTTADERERDIMIESLPGNERLSGTLERSRERRFGRRSVSPKDTDSELSGKQMYDSVSSPGRLDKQLELGSDDCRSARHCRSSTGDKQKFSSSPMSPEKSPITCVTVRHRLNSDCMIVSMGPTSNLHTNERDRFTSRSSGPIHLEDHSKPSALESSKGHALEVTRQFSNSETERPNSLRTATVRESLTRSADNNVIQRRSTDKFEGSPEHPSVAIRLSAGGKSGDPDRRPASIPAHSPENRVINDSSGRRSSADFPVCQTSPSYCIRDMAALFENRRDATSQAPPRPAPTGKQYLSSV